MQTQAIQRQYDEVIGDHYDLDPQSIIGDSLDRAIAQIRGSELGGRRGPPRKVLDLGMGTGRFFEKLRPLLGEIAPFGIDISQKMIDIAGNRIPDLHAVVDDAANLDEHFADEAFDLVSSHFVTGFIPIDVLAPKVHARLTPGGYWSFVGGTTAGFPALQEKANGRLLGWLTGQKETRLGDVICNPAGREEVVGALRAHGFTVRACETFRPPVEFRNFDDFMEFAYYGGWLTPIIEAIGLHQAKPVARKLLNAFVFPVRDHHEIEIVLAQKCS